MAKKDKNTASFLSLVFGWFGLHQIYLKQPGKALFFILPLILIKPTMLGFFVAAMFGFVNALILMMMPQEHFDKRYNSNSRDTSPRWDRNRDYKRRDYERQQRWERRHQARTVQRPTENPYSRRATQRTTPVERRRKPNPFKITGVSKYKEYDFDEAIKDFIKALELEPNDIATHFNIACAYSLTEQKEKAFYHLDRAVALGFNQFDKIRTHDDLAFIRIQPEYETFQDNQFRLSGSEKQQVKEKAAPDDQLLNQLQKLAELREKGLITEEEYVKEKGKLSR